MEHDEEAALDSLLKAVDTLPAEERAEVLRFLLRRGLSMPPAPAFLHVASSSLAGPGFISNPRPRAEPANFTGISGGAQQMVPVRFATESHQRLRAWCGDNGFPMAAVVRGLVDRFLDEQAV